MRVSVTPTRSRRAANPSSLSKRLIATSSSSPRAVPVRPRELRPAGYHSPAPGDESELDSRRLAGQRRYGGEVEVGIRREVEVVGEDLQRNVGDDLGDRA